jgi:hypothetical protein
MNKLTQDGNSYSINNSKSFQNPVAFNAETIEKVFNFAYEMSFGDGEHRDHRTGGSLNRKKGQIFINTFQGKLSELAVYNIFFTNNKKAYDRLSKPDFDVYGLGEWDDSDIVLDDIKFSIKSTKFYGNLLLLETKDWSGNGEYIPNLNTNKNSIYDYFILVRIKADGEKIMRDNRLLYSNDIDKSTLHSLIKNEKWEYDIAGYITNDDLKFLINNNFILPKSSMLNGKIQMDAENYYVQSADMKDFQKLISSL